MSPSTAKRVLVYRFDRQPLEGFVSMHTWLQEHSLELMSIQGTVQPVPYEETKALCFASEMTDADLFREHNLFERRPRVPGLWTRFVFRDGDRLDGILSPNLLEWPEHGFIITPPRAGAARQRVFIPRAALVGTELRGVVGTSRLGSETRRRETAGEQTQLKMFER